MTRFARNSLTLFASAFYLCGFVAYAEDKQEEGSEEIIPPTPIYRVDPTHPDNLYKKGVEGEAIIIASVDLFGGIADPIVEMTTHEEFGLAAILALSEWTFEPATKNGVPIEVKVRIPFKFDISFEHKLNVELGRDVFRELDAAIIPSFELDEEPMPTFVPPLVDFYPEEFRNTGESAAISLEFVIDPKGNVVNPRIISISKTGFEHAALRAVSHMRYKAIKLSGEPVYVSLMMPIQLSE